MLVLMIVAALAGPAAHMANARASAAQAVPPAVSREVAPTGDASLGSLVSGEEAYVDGTQVWTDYVYDDRGPNSDVLPGGDTPYPGAPHPLGTADLVQVQLGTAPGGALRVKALLRTVVSDRHALVGIGFDEDQRSSTGAPTLPGAAWSNTEPLGLEHLVALGTDGRGALWTWRGGRWTAGPTLTVEVDRQSNTVGLDVAGLRPGASQWNVVGVAGRLAGGGSWLDGGLPIQDLAYLRAEDPTDIGALSVPQQLPQDNYQPYQDWDQADVLAGRLPVERAIGTVTFGTRRDVEPPVRTGFNAFLYHSTAPVPEGEQGPVRLFSSAFQPYGVWIPRTLPTRRPLVVFLHGSNQYQNVNVVYFNNPFDPAGIQPFHDLQAVTIFPNGRTPQWGAPLADRDALDAMNDALGRRQLRLDRDRIVVTGISSGGYGSFHLASRYPDLFTGAYSIVGGAVGDDGPDATPLENLTNLPFRASNGAADPLVAYPTWRSSADGLRAAGTVDYRTVLIHTGSHNGAVAEGACFLEDLVSRDRVRNPAQVRFRVPIVDPELARLGLAPRGAYWANRLMPRNRQRSASIDAVSHARRPRVLRASIAENGNNVVLGADFCGPNPTLIRGQSWQTEGRRFGVGMLAPERRRNQVVVTLENLRSGSLDLRRAGLDVRRQVTLVVRSDAGTALSLRGWPAGVVVTRVGRRVVDRSRVDHHTVVLDTTKGRRTYRLNLD